MASSSSSSSSRLEISLEAPPPDRDPVTGRPLILYDFAEGGVPVWKQEESSEEVLGKTVRRIWEEKGGLANFTQLELNDKINEEEERGGGGDVELIKDESADMEDAEGTEEATTQSPLREIDPEEMKAFKFQIAQRLQQASHALEHFHYIITLLLPSTSQLASHALPPGVPFLPSSFSTTHTLPKPATPVPPLDHLAEKQAALRATAEMFKKSGEELSSVVKRGQGEWEVALGVRELGGWAVGLRGAERGFMGETSGKRDARDWVGWYALDAAPPSFRMRHYAHLPAPDASFSSSASSSTQQSKLVFPNRTRRRLQVTITRTSSDGSVVSSSSECLARSPSPSEEGEGEGGVEVDGGKEAAKEMEEAMWEAVEEETFAEVIAEARQLVQVLPSRITHNSIKIEVSPGLELAISLIIPTSSSSPTTPPSSSSAYPTLLSSYLTLCLLSLHSHRSTHLALASQPVRDPRAFSSSTSSRPKILQPVVEVVQFKGLEERVGGLIEVLKDALSGGAGEGKDKAKEREGSGTKSAKGGIGMKVRVEWEGDEDGSWEAVETGGRSGVKVRDEGRKVVLWLEDCPPITIQVLPPLRLNLLVPNHTSSNSIPNPAQPKPKTNTVTITDLVHLASLLELEIKDVVLKKLAGIAKEDVEEGEGRDGKGTTEGFVDRLQGVALLQWEKGEVRFEPLVTLATSTFKPSIYIRAMVRSLLDPEGKEVVFESGNGSGKGVWDWARGVWRGARY
ncbi:subunit 17 of mediator complex-domain-containing protein [Mrakia frigida]|uniref:subunit 17 of mediator complex-domain-containing protein n=1 Tax=Mrakia frigida TaxID=29902 RepID=UPI003FCBF64D